MLSCAASSRLGLKNVAIITLEQLAPFPFDRVKQVRRKSYGVSEGSAVNMLLFFVHRLVELGSVLLGVDTDALRAFDCARKEGHRSCS